MYNVLVVVERLSLGFDSECQPVDIGNGLMRIVVMFVKKRVTDIHLSGLAKVGRLLAGYRRGDATFTGPVGSVVKSYREHI